MLEIASHAIGLQCALGRVVAGAFEYVGGLGAEIHLIGAVAHLGLKLCDQRLELGVIDGLDLGEGFDQVLGAGVLSFSFSFSFSFFLFVVAIVFLVVVVAAFAIARLRGPIGIFPTCPKPGAAGRWLLLLGILTVFWRILLEGTPQQRPQDRRGPCSGFDRQQRSVFAQGAGVAKLALGDHCDHPSQRAQLGSGDPDQPSGQVSGEGVDPLLFGGVSAELCDEGMSDDDVDLVFLIQELSYILRRK